MRKIFGCLTYGGMKSPNIAVSKNGDTAPVLSVACSLNHIRRQSEEARSVLTLMFEGITAVAKERGFSEEGLMDAISTTTVRELMEMLQIDDKTILDMDTKLHGIVNIR